VQDNLNTHNPASLYEAFTASEARRLVESFEWHYTPKHGSRLNMPESELAILFSQCIDRRIRRRSLERQVTAWLGDRNIHNVKADWRFTAAGARIKLKITRHFEVQSVDGHGPSPDLLVFANPSQSRFGP
jgi:hypothetical protein